MSREISTEKAPAAIGPYVQGVDLGSMIMTSGQIPVCPKTGVVPDDIAAQAGEAEGDRRPVVVGRGDVEGKEAVGGGADLAGGEAGMTLRVGGAGSGRMKVHQLGRKDRRRRPHFARVRMTPPPGVLRTTPCGSV